MKNFARKLIFKQLADLHFGQLTIKDKHHTLTFGDKTPTSGLNATIVVHDFRFYTFVLKGGSLAAAEAYARGYWDTDNLTSLIRFFLQNQRILNRFEQGVAKLVGLFRTLAYQFKRNHQTGSRRNIASHYDLSNDFFATFLDDSMMYSSAIFPTQDANLNEAARYKLEVICQKLNLKPSDRVIEIGTGWGGFAIHAAENYGCHVVTTTISQQQYDLASQRIAEKNLGAQITLLKEDYRNLTGQYDKLVSIEMIEAVGYQYYSQFFESCSRLLKDDGQLLIQAITIQDQAYERAKHEVDFIKQYIFPGSCIPSVTALLNAMTRASDMRLVQLDDIGLHYATTLKRWHDTFQQQRPAIMDLGFDERFMRLWAFYFCYCEAGFAEGYLGNVHLHCMKPKARRAEFALAN